MRPGVWSARCALVAVLVLTMAAGTAYGTRGFEAGSSVVEISASGTVTYTALLSVSCPMTLSGIVDTQIPATVGALAGLVRSGRVAEPFLCSGGSISLLEAESLYWPVRYRAIGGTWPRITSVTLDLDGTAILGNISGVGCLFRGTLPGRTNGAEVTSIRIDETASIPVLTRLSAFCPSSGRAAGTLAVSPTVRLRALETLAGHLISPNSYIRVPAEANQITVRAENNGDAPVSLETNQVILTLAEGEAEYAVDRATCENIAPRNACDIILTIRSRPTRGRMTVRYVAGAAQRYEVPLSAP